MNHFICISTTSLICGVAFAEIESRPNIVAGQGFNPGTSDEYSLGYGYNFPSSDQGFNSGSSGQGYNVGSSGQGYNSGSSGIGYNPGSCGNTCDTGSGQGYNPGQPREPAPSFNPVAFSARKASRSYQGQGQIIFERSLTNLGGGWSGVNGEFRAPNSGTYQFSWSALSPDREHLKLVLRRNLQEVAASWGARDGYQTASGTTVLTLRRGDRVSLWVEEGSVYEPRQTQTGYTTFSGYRLG